VGGTPLIDVTFQQNPQGRDIDQCVKVLMQRAEVTVHAPLLATISDFFTPKTPVDLSVVRGWSKEAAATLLTSTSKSLADSLREHTSTDISVTLSAPSIILPFDPRNPQSDALIAHLGEFQLATKALNKTQVADTILALQTAGQGQKVFSEADKARLYDHFTLQILHPELYFTTIDQHRGEPVRRLGVERMSRAEAADTGGKLFLVDPFNIFLDIHSCISPTTAWLPKALVAVSLPELRANLSQARIHKLVELVTIVGSLVPAASAPSLTRQPRVDGIIDDPLDGVADDAVLGPEDLEVVRKNMIYPQSIYNRVPYGPMIISCL
jgi:hypothetical protein